MKAEYILCEPHELKPGQWTVWPLEGECYARCPNGLITNLSAHTRTIDSHGGPPLLTVTPSILCNGGGERFHGFIEGGVWLDDRRQPCSPAPTEAPRT